MKSLGLFVFDEFFRNFMRNFANYFPMQKIFISNQDM